MERGDEVDAVAAPPAPPAAGEATSDGHLPVADLRRMLVEHLPADDLERESIATFLTALGGLDRPYDEDADPTHVTASAVVVGRQGTVLHVHRRLGRWLQPGGHVDAGESPPEAALREAVEETGLTLAHPPSGPVLVHVDVHPAAGDHRHLDLRYLLLGPDEQPAPPPGESPDVRWFAWDDALELADAGLATALRRARAWAEAAGTGR